MSEFILLFLLTAIVVGWYFERGRRIKRALFSMPRTKVSLLRSHEAQKVIGRVKATEHVLEALLTARKGVYYKVSVEEYRRYGKGGRWIPLFTEEEAVDFELVDGSGSARILMASATVAVFQDDKSRIFKSPTPPLQKLLDMRGVSGTGWFRSPLRYVEDVLQIGEIIAVGGMVHMEVDPDGVSTDSGQAPQRPVLAVADECPLFVTNDFNLVD